MKILKRNRIPIIVTALAVLLGFYGVHHVSAQFGATFPPGTAALPTSLAALATSTGAAGTVTNTSAFLMQVDGGPIYCFGAEENISESNITLAANTTYMIVFNCPQEAVYAKTAVTAPGTPTSTGTGVNTLLAAIPNTEVPLATVVCGASTCATITDNRPTNSFPAAKMLAKSTFANLPSTYPDGGMLICTSCTQPTTGSVTATSGAAVVLLVRVGGAWRAY